MVFGEYVIPENRFGACWVYSKGIMKDWIKSKSFLNFNYPNANGGIRVKMGTRLLGKKRVHSNRREKQKATHRIASFTVQLGVLFYSSKRISHIKKR